MLSPISQTSTFSAASALTSVGPSSYRDRTAELFAIAEGLQKAPPLPGAANGDVTSGFARSSDKSLATVPVGGSPGGIAGAGGPGASSAGSAVQSEFNRRASRIGLCIHQTTQKLQKLAKLAKRTSMFDDPTAEIQDLTAVIKQDITALNASISDLQALCEAQAEASGGKKGQNRHTSEHSNTVVDNLKSRLMNTTKEFKDVLTMRTENLKVHENRRQLFSATSGIAGASGARQRPAAAALSAAPPPWAVASGASSSATSASQLFSNTPRCIRDGGTTMEGREEHRECMLSKLMLTLCPLLHNDVSLFLVFSLCPTLPYPPYFALPAPLPGASSSPCSSSGTRRSHPFDPLQQQGQQQALIAQQDSYMSSRSEALQNVETTIVELSTIFRDLATMVAQQGEMAIR
ncbi:unnamed protein product [Closterium sp. NIES-54]